MKNKILLKGFVVVISLVISIIFTSLISADTGDDYGHHMMMYDWMAGNYSGMWGMGIFGWIFGILIITALVLVIVWLIKQIQK